MAVGPFSPPITQPNLTHDFTDPTQPTTYAVTRDPPNIEQQHNVVQIAKNVTHNIQMFNSCQSKQEVKVIWQKAPHGGPIPRSGVTPGGRKLYHWIPGVGFPISVL